MSVSIYQEKVVKELYKKSLKDPRFLGKLIREFFRLVDKASPKELKEFFDELRKEAKNKSDEKLIKWLMDLPGEIYEKYRERLEGVVEKRKLKQLDIMLDRMHKINKVRRKKLKQALKKFEQDITKQRSDIASKKFSDANAIAVMTHLMSLIMAISGLFQLYGTTNLKELFKKILEDLKQGEPRGYAALLIIMFIVIVGYRLVKKLIYLFRKRGK